MVDGGVGSGRLDFVLKIGLCGSFCLRRDL